MGFLVPLQGWLGRRLRLKPVCLQSDTSALSIFGAGRFFVMGCPVYYHQDVLNVGAVFLPHPPSPLIALPVHKAGVFPNDRISSMLLAITHVSYKS